MVTWVGTVANETKFGSDSADQLDGAGGNDTLHGLAGDDELRGSAGNDYLYGWEGADQLFGGDGNDWIVMGRPDFFGTPGGTYGSDIADGGAGVDMIVVSWWNQLINGVDTSITLDFGNGTFTVHGGGSDWEQASNFEQLSYYGSDGGDIVTGGDSDDFFHLGKGNDVLRAKGGNDYFYDNGGAFDIDGGTGIDTLRLDTLSTLSSGATFKLTGGGVAVVGGSLSGTVKNVDVLYIEWMSGTGFADFFTGGNYDDTIHGGAGNDTIQGGNGEDKLVGQAGNDIIYGGAGRDNIDGGGFLGVDQNFTGHDTLYGEDGNDVMHAGSDGSTMRGGTGHDNLTGGPGVDIMYGDAGNDTISGGGNDKIYAGDGNDLLTSGIGADRIDGGAGIDGLTFNRTTVDPKTLREYGVTVDLVNQERNAGTEAAGDLYSSIENLKGTYSGEDIFRGNSAANILDGDGNADILEGRGGADQLIGGPSEFGPRGIDTASYLSAPAGVTADLAAPAGNTGDAKGDTYVSIENLEGSAFADKLTGNTVANVLTGLGGNDRLIGLGGNDTLGGGVGIDRLEGGVGNDTYTIGHAADVLVEVSGIDLVRSTVTKTLSTGFENLTLLGTVGLSGTGNTAANILTGNTGANVLTGLGGNDTIIGGAGNDRLVGGLGKDTMTGSAGADKFDFNLTTESVKGVNRDVILDFVRAQGDKIDLLTIDADTDGTTGNQAFAFIGTAAFTGVDGQLRCSAGIIQGDVNGDRVADFEIKVNPATLLATDFIL